MFVELMPVLADRTVLITVAKSEVTSIKCSPQGITSQ